MTKTDQLWIALKSLKFSYPNNKRPLFDDLTWSVPADRITAIVGPSGVGKSTLLRLIHGIEQPQQGSIAFPAFARRPSIASLPQEQMLLPWRTGKANLTLVRSLLADRQPITEEEFSGKLQQALEIAAFASSLELYPVQMSGGMRQRLALARALLMAGDILLLDEPFGGIDFPLKLRIIERLHNHIRSRHIVCLVVTHDIEDAVALADQIVVLAGAPVRAMKRHDLSAEISGLSPSDRRRSPTFHQHVEQVLALMNADHGAEVGA
jgi:ABC-type nitrate/sulfonate/bicarbonate transport system ATPase subunit